MDFPVDSNNIKQDDQHISNRKKIIILSDDEDSFSEHSLKVMNSLNLDVKCGFPSRD